MLGRGQYTFPSRAKIVIDPGNFENNQLALSFELVEGQKLLCLVCEESCLRLSRITDDAVSTARACRRPVEEA